MCCFHASSLLPSCLGRAGRSAFVDRLLRHFRLLAPCRDLSRTDERETVVYNARKRGEDRASDYFKRTENVAGVKDMRFQALMPDILHWLGITKIDRMLSMSK